MSTDERREHNRKYYQKIKAKREAIKQQQLENRVKSGDVNAGLKPVLDEFLSYSEWKQAHSKGDFKQYLGEKEEFTSETRPAPLDRDYILATSDPTRCRICKKPLLQSTIEDGYSTCPKHRKRSS